MPEQDKSLVIYHLTFLIYHFKALSVVSSQSSVVVADHEYGPMTNEKCQIMSNDISPMISLVLPLDEIL